MMAYNAFLERVTRVSHPGNPDAFGRGIEMALVKRQRKGFVADEVYQLREVEEVDREYGDDEEESECANVWDETSKYTQEALALQQEADAAASELESLNDQLDITATFWNTANAHRLGTSLEIVKEALAKTNKELVDVRVELGMARSKQKSAEAESVAALAALGKAEEASNRSGGAARLVEFGDIIKALQEKNALGALQDEKKKTIIELDALRAELDTQKEKEKAMLEFDTLKAERDALKLDSSALTAEIEALKKSEKAARDSIERDRATIGTLRNIITENTANAASERLQAVTAAREAETRISVLEAEARVRVSANAVLAGENRRLLIRIGRITHERTAAIAHADEVSNQVAILNQDKMTAMVSRARLARDNAIKDALMDELRTELRGDREANTEKTLEIARLQASAARAKKTQEVLAGLTTAIEAANADYVQRIERENTSLNRNAVVAGRMADENRALRDDIARITVRAEVAEASQAGLLQERTDNVEKIAVLEQQSTDGIAKSLGGAVDGIMRLESTISGFSKTAVERLVKIQGAVGENEGRLKKINQSVEGITKLQSSVGRAVGSLDKTQRELASQSDHVKAGLKETDQRLLKISITSDMSLSRISDISFEVDVLQKALAEMAGVTMRSDSLSLIKNSVGDSLELIRQLLETSIERSQNAIAERIDSGEVRSLASQSKTRCEIGTAVDKLRYQVDDVVTNARNYIREILYDLRRDSITSSSFDLQIERVSGALEQMDKKVDRMQKAVGGSEDCRMEAIMMVVDSFRDSASKAATTADVSKAIADQIEQWRGVVAQAVADGFGRSKVEVAQAVADEIGRSKIEVARAVADGFGRSKVEVARAVADEIGKAVADEFGRSALTKSEIGKVITDEFGRSKIDMSQAIVDQFERSAITKGEISKVIADQFERSTTAEKERVRTERQEEEAQAELCRKARVSIGCGPSTPSIASVGCGPDGSFSRTYSLTMSPPTSSRSSTTSPPASSRSSSITAMTPPLSTSPSASTPAATGSSEYNESPLQNSSGSSSHFRNAEFNDSEPTRLNPTVEKPIEKLVADAAMPSPVISRPDPANACRSDPIGVSRLDPILSDASRSDPILPLAASRPNHIPSPAVSGPTVIPPNAPANSNAPVPAVPAPVAAPVEPLPLGMPVGSLDFRFLVSGSLENGVFATHVHEDTLNAVTHAIEPLRNRKKFWRPHPAVVRCLFHRVERRENDQRNAREGRNICCKGCVRFGTPCIVYGADDIPTVLPLALHIRAENASPASAGFFLVEPVAQ